MTGTPSASPSSPCSSRGAITASRPSSGTRSPTTEATAPGSSPEPPAATANGRTPVSRTDRGGSNAGSPARTTAAATSMISAGVR